MWDFFSKLLEHPQGGVYAVAVVALGVMYGFAVRALWRANQTQHKEYEALSRKNTGALEKLAIENADALAKLNSSYSSALMDLQERRVEESKALNDVLYKALREIDASNNELRAAMSALTHVLQDSHGGRR